MPQEKMTRDRLLAWISELYAQENDVFLRALITHLAEKTNGFTQASRLVFLGNAFAALCSTIGIEGAATSAKEIEELLLQKIGITLHSSGSADEIEPERKRLREYGLSLYVQLVQATDDRDNGVLLSFE